MYHAFTGATWRSGTWLATSPYAPKNFACTASAFERSSGECDEYERAGKSEKASSGDGVQRALAEPGLWF